MASSARHSAGFDRLAEPIRHWIWQQGWQELRDIQERAIHAILDGERDVIIAAATAGGKTEAAFLPLLSRLLSTGPARRGFDLLYVSPLKALINDQFRRLERLCERLQLPVHRWHGDVSAAAKAKARQRPHGVLLITPESLEALFVLRGLEVPGLFANLEAVVIDELHALMDTERGVHLRSLLNRIEVATRRRVRRIGLSATLGDMRLAAGYLRPAAAAEDVEVLSSRSDAQELKLQLRGYRIGGAHPDAEETGESDTDTLLAADRAVAEHVFATLRGSQNLIFAGSRQAVELYADMLREMSAAAGLPNEFYPHHANLSRDHREFVEARLRRAETPTSAVCTSTLELGIDIGEVESIAQIGAPFSVAAMRQRLGRSGRRASRPAIMRLYLQEKSLRADSDPLDELRLRLVQTVAMVELLIRGWCEPPSPHALHLSTLVHQILSVIAERGGATARRLYAVLCESGPFRDVTPEVFAQALRAIGEEQTALIEQAPDGTLLLGATGERLVEHHSFYAAFATPEEYRVMAADRLLGTLPVTFALVPSTTIVFSGRRWRISEVRDREKVILVVPDPSGRPPTFGGDPMCLDDAIAAEMRALYGGDRIPPYLDATARELLSEGRAAFHRHALAASGVLATARDRTLLFPWRGTVATQSLALALHRLGLPATSKHLVIDVNAPRPAVDAALRELAASPPPNPAALAERIANLDCEKFHRFLSRGLLILDAASHRVAAEMVPRMAADLCGLEHAGNPHPRSGAPAVD